MMGRPVIIDADPGVDDALAIIFSIRSPELDVRAITTVCGNTDVDKTSINALKILEALGETNIPVAKGAAKPLKRNLEADSDFFGKDGLGDSNLHAPRLQLDRRQAVALLLEETGKDPGRNTILAIGPLTNIALAILQDATFAKNVRDLVMMGGAYALTPYGYGNMSAVSEFNIWVDPEAADIVFKSGIPMTAIGLDVTTDPSAAVDKRLYKKIEHTETPTSDLVVKITRQWVSRYGLMHLHDPMAAAYLIEPGLFTTKDYYVEVETVGTLTRGQTIADRRGAATDRKKPNAKICVSVDGPKFLELFTRRAVGISI